MMKKPFFLFPLFVLSLLLGPASVVQANIVEDAVASLEECKTINLKDCAALAQLHKNPTDAIPLLVSHLQHREAKKRIVAAQSLRFFEDNES